jgi:hypothetical protein
VSTVSQGSFGHKFIAIHARSLDELALAPHAPPTIAGSIHAAQEMPPRAYAHAFHHAVKFTVSDPGEFIIAITTVHIWIIPAIS